MRAATAPDDATLGRLAAALGERLRARHWRIATAESSTAGLIGHAITKIPGASDYYVGGVICYSDLAKERLLGVERALIRDHGAVSEEVAAAMAQGAWHRFGVEMGVAVTGIAGPDGATPTKPIGLHFIAVAQVGHPPVVERHEFSFDRDGNRAAAAAAALELATREASSAA
jgi:PncC family amidohydrolase